MTAHFVYFLDEFTKRGFDQITQPKQEPKTTTRWSFARAKSAFIDANSPGEQV